MVIDFAVKAGYGLSAFYGLLIVKRYVQDYKESVEKEKASS